MKRTKEQMEKLRAFIDAIDNPSAPQLPITYRLWDCPHCQISFSTEKVGWSSRMSSVTRSDGKVTSLNLKSPPTWIKCPHCKSEINFLQLRLDDENDELFMEGDTALAVAPLHLLLTSEDYLNLGKKPDISEVTIRDFYMYAWHSFNDLREKENNWDLKPKDTEFLNVILEKLNTLSADETLLKAELLRELGRFEKAATEIDQDYDDETSKSHAEQIMQAIEQADSIPFNFDSNERDEDFEFMMAWHARRYKSETPEETNEELDPPAFKISNRDWWVKVLGMLSHNWALIEKNEDQTATVYFFQDSTPDDRPGVVDSLNFFSLDEAEQGLYRNDFSPLKTTPGPWMGEEPRGQIYDQRSVGNFIYSKLGYWVN